MAGTIKANAVQLGDSVTAANNFVLQTNTDGTAKLSRGNLGATTQDILTVDAVGATNAPVSFNTPLLLQSGTAVNRLVTSTAKNTTSGASIDFLEIPTWVKRIAIVFTGVSTNGISAVQLQLGTSSGFETTGYLGSGINLDNGITPNIANNTSGFRWEYSGASTVVRHGCAYLIQISANFWAFSLNGGRSDTTAGLLGGGSKNLAGVLDRLRLTTIGGTDTFDAGSVNIMYEG